MLTRHNTIWYHWNELTTLQGLYSLSGRTPYCKISWSIEAVRFGLDFSNHSEIWQAPRQQRCRVACQISERYEHYNTQSRGLETSRKDFGGKTFVSLMNTCLADLCCVLLGNRSRRCVTCYRFQMNINTINLKMTQMKIGQRICSSVMDISAKFQESALRIGRNVFTMALIFWGCWLIKAINLVPYRYI